MTTARWLLTAVACILLIALLAGYKFFQISSAIAAAESYPEQSETVSLATVQTLEFQPTIKVMGEIQVPERLTLRTELPGRVTTIAAKPGELIRKGQVIFQIDISEELAKQQSAEARLQLAELNLKRVKDLRKRNTVSQSELDTAISEAEVIRSEIAVNNTNIQKKTLRAPFDGVLGLYQLEEGSYLQANTEIAEFVGNQNWLWVEFSVPQFYPLLEKGTEVEVNLAGSGDETYSAKVVARDPVASSATRTRTYRARMENPPPAFVQNISVQVSVPNGKPLQLAVTPLESIQYDEGGTFVYQLLKEPSGSNYRAERRPVVVYKKQSDRVLIEQGLNSNELLAGVGAFKLHPGILVYPSATSTQTDQESEKPEQQELNISEM